MTLTPTGTYRGAPTDQPDLGPHEAQLDTPVPAHVRSEVVLLAQRSRVAPGSLWLAAHARVLQALSGEGEVSTGEVTDRSGTVRRRTMVVAGSSWRSLVTAADRAKGDEGEGPSSPGGGTVIDPGAGVDGDLPDGTALRVAVRHTPTGDVLRLRYRTDRWDEAAAARIAGYHLAALTHLLRCPEADPEDADLVGPDERRFQLEKLAGPRRVRPDRRFHELFEDRVRQHPDRIAAVQDTRQWTYAELNVRANHLARALLARGLQPEGVVAVVAERDLEWMAGVIAILKAGGAYLPIEPHFPPDRIARTLIRAECQLVLAEGAATTSLDTALTGLPEVRTVLVEEVEAEGHADENPGIPVRSDQLAYVYFTSGSTGEPKGASCEHAGLVNHLFAKVEDLGIGPADVVAQSAPQCFDISLWQLVSALLVGGRTLIVGQERILDVERFLDTIEQGRVAVFQVVPSYLEAIVAYLERTPRSLSDLRCVSATGEALKHELVRRWFTVLPDVQLVNAYGLTETSDDTNHEVMSAVPAGECVPLGRPVANVRIHLLDDRQRLVPFGAPGEIAFSGVCVGRGYVNDPERTALAYSTDPYHPGERLYRAGDYGRWLPDGKLEYLGRRDSQVKISGFRIEIGEVENALLRVPGVRDGAAVVAERPDRGAHLVAFYQAPAPLDGDAVRARLAGSLPAYMVPQVLHWQAALPLTDNGKVDRKRLTALAGDLDVVAGALDPPRTATELWLASAWSQVLGIPQDRIDRRDHFFDRGGSSLSAVKLAIALDRAVALKDLLRHPVLAELAAEVDARSLAVATPRTPERPPDA
jgi:amino acid adenylation domain-containing protein